MRFTNFELCHICFKSVFRPSTENIRLPDIFSTAACEHLTCQSCAQDSPSLTTCRVANCGAPSLETPRHQSLLDFIELKQKAVREVFPETYRPNTLHQRSYINVTSSTPEHITLVDLPFIKKNLGAENTFVFMNDLFAKMSIDFGTIRADWTAFKSWCRALKFWFWMEDAIAEELDALIHCLTNYSLWDLKYPCGRFVIEPYFRHFKVKSQPLKLASHLLQKVVRLKSPRLAEPLLSELLFTLFEMDGISKQSLLLPLPAPLPPPIYQLPCLNGNWPLFAPNSPETPDLFRSHPIKKTQIRAIRMVQFQKARRTLRKGIPEAMLVSPRDIPFLVSCFPSITDFKSTIALSGLGVTSGQAYQACHRMEQVLILFESQGTVAGVYRDITLTKEETCVSSASFFLWVSGGRVWRPTPDNLIGDYRFPPSFPIFGGELTSSTHPQEH